ncbi:MAG: sulfotransferase family protein [Thermoanaerobaculia bacterium]
MTRNPGRVSIDRVELLEPLPEAIRELSLDRPVAGSEWRGSSLEVSGWVVGKWSAPLRVAVLRQGRPLRRIPVRMPRFDITRRFPDVPGAETPGFTAMVSTLGLPEDFRLEIAMAFQDGSRATVARLEGRRTLLRPDFQPALQPIMVTSLGRMASTWVMSLLAAHPQIVALRKYPYECKTAKYWLQVLATLMEPAMQPRDVAKVHGDRWWLGANPFFEPDMTREPKPGVGLFADRMAEVCLRNIDSWYSELAFHQVKDNVRCFAEKMTPNQLQPLMRELYPRAKEIVLVRDFRDWICSILAFDDKRGFHGFGRREGEPAVDYVRRHARFAFELRDYWKTHRAAVHLVRYEDLVREPAPALRALFEHLELDAGDSCVEAALREAQTESASFQHHRTSSSISSSIGRWRHELTPEVCDVAQELFADALRSFGYDDESDGLPASRVEEGGSG